MDYEKASTDFRRYLPLKALTLLWFFAVFGACLYGIAATWNEWWPYTDLDIRNLDEAKPAIYSFIAGMIGATVYAFRGFYWAVGPQNPDNPRYQYDPNWTIWYVSRPVMGGFLGAFVFAIVRAGVGTLGSATTDDTAAAAYFAIAFLAGFAATDVFNWLTTAAKRMFERDANRSD